MRASTDSYFQYRNVDYKSQFGALLDNKEVWIERDMERGQMLPWSKEVQVDEKYRDVLLSKPVVNGTKPHRSCKDQLYDAMYQLCKRNDIKGRMVTLGAAYAPEIFTRFADLVEGDLNTCEMDPDSAQELRRYYELVNTFYPRKIRLHECDVFRYLSTPKQMSIIDLDLMCGLNSSLIDRIAETLPVCTANKSVFALWTTMGRVDWSTNNLYATEYRPYILWKLFWAPDAKFNLLDYEIYGYCDNHQPMKVEVLAVEKK